MSKILLVGPPKSGKTCVANLLGDNLIGLTASGNANTRQQTSLRNVPYLPTAGTRVLEFDVMLSPKGSRYWDGASKATVELWDCSGDTCYERCWEAIKADAQGVVLVFNPENTDQRIQVENYYNWFVHDSGLAHEQCLILANDRKSGHHDIKARLPSSLDDVEVVHVDADETDLIKSVFAEFVGKLGKFVGEEEKR